MCVRAAPICTEYHTCRCRRCKYEYRIHLRIFGLAVGRRDTINTCAKNSFEVVNRVECNVGLRFSRGWNTDRNSFFPSKQQTEAIRYLRCAEAFLRSLHIYFRVKFVCVKSIVNLYELFTVFFEFIEWIAVENWKKKENNLCTYSITISLKISIISSSSLPFCKKCSRFAGTSKSFWSKSNETKIESG